MNQLLAPSQNDEPSKSPLDRRARTRVPAERLAHPAVVPTRLTLSPEQLVELTGYKRGIEQARWLKENGFKFRLDRRRQPRVDRLHYEARMGSRPTPDERGDGGSPNWAALMGA